ncbi:MAG: methyltransferase family protein [Candidatus Cryptobacteroides sp.]
MASICVHRATRTPPDSTPGHIGSRDGLQEEEFLRETFGAEYEEYCRKVRRYI